MPRSWDTSVTSSSGSRSLREPRNAYAGYLAWRARVSEVSVVIPTMNEEASIGRVIDEVRKALGGRLLEILVVDTDSRDRTREIATAKGARVISEPRLVHEGMAFSEEIKIEALRVGLRFLEISVDYRVRVGDRKIRSMNDAMKNLVWLVRKRFGWHPGLR